MRSVSIYETNFCKLSKQHREYLLAQATHKNIGRSGKLSSAVITRKLIQY